MRRSLLLTAAGAVVALALGAGCTTGVGDAEAPLCSTDRVEALVVVAQSVPTAGRVPCISSYPAGWKLGTVDVHNGRSSFELKAGDDGSEVNVVLEKECDVTGAVEVATDERGTARYDRLPSPTEARTVRNYKFAGGCVTYEFHFGGPRSALLDQASLAIGLVSRSDIETKFYGGAK